MGSEKERQEEKGKGEMEERKETGRNGKEIRETGRDREKWEERKRDWARQEEGERARQEEKRQKK